MAELARHWRLPRPLERGHATDLFHSGSPGIDDWLARFAWEGQRAGMTRVYVSESDGRIAAFYALSTGGVEPAHPPASAPAETGQEVPVLLLTRLAVDTHWQGEGLGRAMLRDALIRVANVSLDVTVGALLIHCPTRSAREFYLGCAEFEQSPTDPLHLFQPIQDPRRF